MTTGNTVPTVTIEGIAQVVAAIMESFRTFEKKPVGKSYRLWGGRELVVSDIRDKQADITINGNMKSPESVELEIWPFVEKLCLEGRPIVVAHDCGRKKVKLHQWSAFPQKLTQTVQNK